MKWDVAAGDSTNKVYKTTRIIIVDAASAERCRFPVRKNNCVINMTFAVVLALCVRRFTMTSFKRGCLVGGLGV